MTILRTEKTKGKAIGWSSIDDWKDTQDLLVTFGAPPLKPQTDLNVYFTNDFLSDVPYMRKK